MAEIIEEGSFDLDAYEEELARAPENLEVGTHLWFENDHIRVWQVKLEPGERGPFHAHTIRYFWTVMDGGTGKQRYEDGTYKVRTYEEGDTNYSEHSPDAPVLHDLENVGETTMRFVTVELLD